MYSTIAKVRRSCLPQRLVVGMMTLLFSLFSKMVGSVPTVGNGCPDDLSNFCLHGGTCIRIPLNATPSNVHSTVHSTVHCQCLNGFFGSRCEFVDSTSQILPSMPEMLGSYSLMPTVIILVIILFLSTCACVLYCRHKRKQKRMKISHEESDAPMVDSEQDPPAQNSLMEPDQKRNSRASFMTCRGDDDDSNSAAAQLV